MHCEINELGDYLAMDESSLSSLKLMCEDERIEEFICVNYTTVGKVYYTEKIVRVYRFFWFEKWLIRKTSITKFTLFERKCKENRYSNGVVHFKLSWLLLLRESSEPNKIVFHQTIPPFSSWKSTITRTKLQITDLWAKSLFILNARDITSVWPLRLNVCH